MVRTRKETTRREAWEMAKQVQTMLGTLEQNKNTFFSPLLDWCMSARSKIQPKEREFVVDWKQQCYVRDVDLFVKLQLLVDTPPVLFLGKLCEDHRYFFRVG